MQQEHGWIVTGHLRESGLSALDQNARDFCDAVAYCLGRNHVLPAVSLCYTWIDTMGALCSPSGKATRTTFEEWLDRYAASWLAERELTSTDIYSARCGVLHTLTPNSKLVEKAQAMSLG
jgi:hypothetical protein